MMISVRQRGSVWWLEGRIGPRRKRVQISLGTRNHGFAIDMARKVEHAMADGDSPIWLELARMLPPLTFQRLRMVGGWPVEGPRLPTWNDLAAKFRGEMDRRIIIGKFRESTKTRYKRTIDDFGEFLSIRGIFTLEDINRGFVEDFKVWKLEQTKKRKQSRPGGRGIVLDAAILHRVFSYAVECELIRRNPVRLEGRPGDNPEGGAQPFKAEDLRKLRDHAGPDLLAFLLLRHTGLRGSDAVLLRWEEIDWEGREISRVTLKRKKQVVLPIHTELFFALENEKLRRDPKPLDRVLLNPTTGQPLTRPRLYERFVALGERADVAHVHPHRFRDTLAVDMLLRGASPYDVAKILGDTIDTVERHYAPFVSELRERVRQIMENGEGLEKVAVTNRGQSPPPERRPN